METVNRLKVGNEDFLVASMIERCPRSMMLRELVKNAIEAALTDPVAAEVEIRPTWVDGAQKYSIWNSGRGMDAEELFRMCDIASSIHKANGLDANFGMGAKVATLPSNPHGVRYRSCRDGHVHQVIMGKREGVYGRLFQSAADQSVAEVINVTTDVLDEGLDLRRDWTEVTLMGRLAHHNTWLDPYCGAPSVAEDWIAAYLYGRFFRLPPSISIRVEDGRRTAGEMAMFRTLFDRVDAFERYERIEGEHGVAAHFFYDAPAASGSLRLASETGALQGAEAATAIVYRDEIYDMKSGAEWRHLAPLFGLPFGAKHLSVYVELPDDYPVRPDGYRQHLQHQDDLQRQVFVREFAPLVLQSRPDWVLDLQQHLRPNGSTKSNVQNEINALFRHLGVRRRSRPQAKGSPVVIHHAVANDPQSCPLSNPEEDAIHYEVAPEIIPLSEPGAIEEQGLSQRAARFIPETHQLFVNLNYSAIVELADHLVRTCEDHSKSDRIQYYATEIAETAVVRQICRRVAFGLARSTDWQPWEIDQALSISSLSLAADDVFDQTESCEIELRDRLTSDLFESSDSISDLDDFAPVIILPKYLKSA